MTDSKQSDRPAATGDSGPAEASRLRDTIDRGGAGDKVAFNDPAAAPLGTDDEAAGTPPTLEQVRMAERQEGARAREAEHKQTPAERNGGISVGMAVVLVIAAAAILATTLLLVG